MVGCNRPDCRLMLVIPLWTQLAIFGQTVLCEQFKTCLAKIAADENIRPTQ